MALQTPSTLAAILNVFVPPFGHLVQARVLAFLIWFVLLGISVALMWVLIGFVTTPILYIWCIVDAARYKS